MLEVHASPPPALRPETRPGPPAPCGHRSCRMLHETRPGPSAPCESGPRRAVFDPLTPLLARVVRAAQVACPSKARGARIRVAVSHVQEGVPSAMFRRECVDLPLFRGALPPGRRGSDSLGAVHVCMYTCVGSTCTCMYVCGSDSFAARRGRTYIHTYMHCVAAKRVTRPL